MDRVSWELGTSVTGLPRVLYCTVVKYPADTANSVQQIKTAHAVARLGVSVDFVTRTEGKEDTPFSEILSLYGLSPESNLHQHAILSTPVGRRRYLGFLLRAMAWCGQRILERGAVIVWAREPRLLLALAPIARIKKATLVFEAHDLADVPGRGISAQTRFFYRLAFRFSDFIITVTDRGKSKIIDQGVRENRIILAPDAAEPIDCSPPRLEPIPPLKLLYMGSLHRDRGCLTLLQSLAHIPSDLDYQVHIVGGRSYQVEQLKAIVGDIGVSERVEFFGHLPHSGTPAMLTGADILIQPMGHSVVADNYASPMKLFEYMSACRPIVACDVPTLREVADESMMHFCRPDDPKSMADAIVSVVRNWDEALVKAAHARQQFMKRYTFDRRARHILETIGREPL